MDPIPQEIIDAGLSEQYQIALDGEMFDVIEMLKQQAGVQPPQELEVQEVISNEDEGTLAGKRDPFARPDFGEPTPKPYRTPVEREEFPMGRPQQTGLEGGALEAEEEALEAGYYYSPRFKTQQKLLEEGLGAEEVDAFRRLKDFYISEGNDVITAMQKANASISIITGGYYTPARDRIDTSDKEGVVSDITEDIGKAPLAPEFGRETERGAFERQLVESPKQVAEKKARRSAGAKVGQKLNTSFGLQAYDIFFDENDNERPLAEKQKLLDEEKIKGLPGTFITPTTTKDDLQTIIKDRFLQAESGDLVREMLVASMRAEGKEVPKPGDENYQDFIDAQLILEEDFLNTVFDYSPVRGDIDPAKRTTGERFIEEVFTTEEGGGIVESQTARGLRVLGGLIRPVTNAIVDGIGYQVQIVDGKAVPVDPNDINYLAATSAEGTAMDYLGYLIPEVKQVVQEGPRQTGYLTHDTFIGATLHDIKVGRFLGDDFVEMPYLVEGLGAMGMDGEAAAMSLGLITEIAMPLTPAGVPGMATKGLGGSTKLAGGTLKAVSRGKVGQKLVDTGTKISKAGDAMLPENVIGTSARYYRLAQEERALKDAGLRGTLSIDEAAAPRAARDFIATTTDDAGKTADDLIPQARTPDGERILSEATTGAKQIDNFAEEVLYADDFFSLPEETQVAMNTWVRSNKEAAKILDIQTGDDLLNALRTSNGIQEVKEATLIPTMRTYLANKVPNDWLFITPTMIGKADKWKEIAGEVNEKMAFWSKSFIEELPGGKFRYLEEPFDSKVNSVLGFDPTEPMTPIQYSKFHDAVKEGFVAETLGTKGSDFGSIGYVGDKAYETMKIPLSRRTRGSISLSPSVKTGALLTPIFGPVVGGAVAIGGLTAEGILNVFGKTKGLAPKLGQALSKPLQFGGDLLATRLLKAKPTPTQPLLIKQTFEAAKSQIRNLPREFALEVQKRIVDGEDPVAVFNDVFSQSVRGSGKYQVNGAFDPIQGAEQFFVDYVKGFFGQDIKFLKPQEILDTVGPQYLDDLVADITRGQDTAAKLIEGIEKLRGRYQMLQDKGFGGKLSGDQFTTYNTTYIIRQRARAIAEQVIEEKIINSPEGQRYLMSSYDFADIARRAEDIVREGDLGATGQAELRRSLRGFGADEGLEPFRAPQQIKSYTLEKITELQQQLDELAPLLEEGVQLSAEQTKTLRQLKGLRLGLDNYFAQVGRALRENADVLLSGYTTDKVASLRNQIVYDLIEVATEGQPAGRSFIEAAKLKIGETVVSNSVSRDFKNFARRLGIETDERQAALWDLTQRLNGEFVPARVNTQSYTEFFREALFQRAVENIMPEAKIIQLRDGLETMGVVFRKEGAAKLDYKQMEPALLQLDEGTFMFGNVETRRIYDELVNSFNSGFFKAGLDNINTRSLTLGDYVLNRATAFIDGTSRSMRNGLLAGKYIFNGRYLGLNNISQPFIQATTTPGYLAKSVLRSMIGLATLGIDPSGFARALQRAGTALPAGGGAVGGTIGMVAAGPVGAGVGLATGYIGTALARNQIAKLGFGLEEFLIKVAEGADRLPKANLGTFYGVRKIDDVYFTAVDGKRWTGRMIDDAIKRNDIYATQVSFEFGEDAIEDMVKATQLTGKGKETAFYGREAAQFLLPHKKSLANIIAEETDLAFRQQVFVSALAGGLTEEQAAILARNTLLDYGGITNKAERAVARRLFLFYAFARQSSAETMRAFLFDPARASVIGKQARFAQNQKKTAELDILLQTSPFPSLRRKNLTSAYARVTEAYEQHLTVLYGPSFPMVESAAMLWDVGNHLGPLYLNALTGDPIPAMAETTKLLSKQAVSRNPLIQQASRVYVDEFTNRSSTTATGYLPDSDFIYLTQSGLIDDLGLMTFFDLQPAEPVRGKARVAADPSMDPQFRERGYAYKFGSQKGEDNYRVFKAFSALLAIDRSLSDWTRSEIKEGLILNNYEEGKFDYRKGKAGTYELFISGLETPIVVPTYLQMEVDLYKQLQKDLEGANRSKRAPRK